MKIKHLLIGMLAMSAAVACQEDLPVEEPALEVSTETVSVAATAGEATFNVTANQSWVATADADWVSMDPSSGDASEKAVTVMVTAEDNETTEARTATVTVKAGKLTKTVTVNQAAGEADEPGPEQPELQQSEWALVGSFGDWKPESGKYLSVLDENYFVYYGFEFASDTEFKFLKGGAWPPAGQEIGGNGLVEPNTIQPAGGSNIKVTETGKYDIYLAADLTKFYIMSEGKLPSEAVEPAPVENQWSMMGCFVDNQWVTDVPMTKEGEWIVAKGAQFTELTFKIRANQSWSDPTNIGVAPGSERGYVNGKVSVVTAEYSKANLGGDAADIKLDGEPGTYDVYFNFEKLEVYVMEQGAKPGEKDPVVPEVPVEITYTVVGTLKDLNWQNGAPEGLMVKEGDYYVGKNIPLVTAKTLYDGADQIEFKVVETGTWTGYGHASKENENFINGEIPVSLGGENIIVKGAEGAYDVYLDKANNKVWVMEPGFKPGEKEPIVPEEPEQPAFVPGEYWIVANEKYAMPLTGSYGYLQVDKAGYTDNVFTFAEVEGGYTIQQPDGKYLYMKDSFDSFNASATVPSAGGHVWTVEKNEDGTYKILNVLKTKYIQLDSQYGTYGSYNAVKGTMPNLVSAEDATVRPVLNLATEAVSVENDETTYTIKITSNVDWTATPSEGVTLDKTSGTGDAEVVMTFAANETEAAVAHTVTFSGEGLTKTFTLTHKAPATGNSLTIELSAATRPCDTFPNTSAGVTTKTTYTIGDYEWTFAPSSGNKFSWYESDKYILWGKSGGYILMPAVEGKKLTSVTILTGKGASTSVKVGVYNEAGTAAVAGGTAIQLDKKNTEFSWTLTDTEVNTHYQLRVTSSHNAQLQKLVLVYE